MIRKLIHAFMMLVVAFSAVGCNSALSDTQSDKSAIGEQDVVKKFDMYDLDIYMKPLWDGDVVYNETLMFVGEEDRAPLLYPAVEIISVRSYDLTKEYVPGVDYEYNAKRNCIVLKENTEMPYIPLKDYYLANPRPGASFPCTVPGKPHISFREGDYFSSKQLAITYRHTGQKNLPAPKSQKEAFANVIEKLQNNQAPKILFYGDSITVGANSSGFVNSAPYADVWAKMVFDSMTKKYGCTNAEYINTAVGGWSSQNGVDGLESSVLAYAPDAVFLAFGMNDVHLTPQEHLQNMQTMVSRIREELPNTSICLIATMLPNAEVKGFYGEQDSFVAEYLTYLAETKLAGETKLCVANVTEMHKGILETKRYYDMTGNNVNHVNDFMSRVYAQTVFQTVCGE